MHASSCGSGEEPECSTQALGTPASFQILQYWVITPSFSRSMRTARPSSFPPNDATRAASTFENCARSESNYVGAQA